MPARAPWCERQPVFGRDVRGECYNCGGGEAVGRGNTLAEFGRNPWENDGPAVAVCADLPFGHLNLRANPFGELESRERAAIAVVDTGPFVERLTRPGRAVQFMGDPGRGKTTHLLAIMAHFSEAAYVHIPEGRQPRIPHGNPLFVDEIQRVSPHRRRRVYRRADRRGVSLAIGSHLDVSGELARTGFDVETVFVADKLDDARLREMLNRRIEWVRRCAGPVPKIALRTARDMMARHGDNIRAIEGHLYELFQDLVEIREV